jgi:transposase
VRDLVQKVEIITTTVNHVNYEKWLQKLIPDLESKSIIVVENACYHRVQLNRHPTSNGRKSEMLFWLDRHGIRYKSDMTKAELYDLMKMHKPQYETFAIDCLVAEHGHTVIRLPPYHPDLNPTEKIWGIVKTRRAVKNVTFTRKLRDIQQLAEQNFAAVAMEEWAAVCRHVKAVEEEEYTSRECEMDSVMERIIINDDDDDDDTSDSTVSCDDNDDIQGVGPIVSDSG